VAITLNINGVARKVDVDGETPLLWVLRDVLGMTGTKFGCGVALCGACTVHIDGVAVRSCITLVDGIGDGAITTIEGASSTSCNAATASPARSCRPQRCSLRHRSPVTTTSTQGCPATSAAAAPISASAPPFTAPRAEENRPAAPGARNRGALPGPGLTQPNTCSPWSSSGAGDSPGGRGSWALRSACARRATGTR